MSKEINCKGCSTIKPSSQFNKDKGSKTGICYYCKECDRLRHKQYRENNREKISEYNRLYKEKKKDHISKYNKQYIKDNKNVLVSKHKIYRAKNRALYNAWQNAREARKILATPLWADRTQIESVYEQAKKLEEQTGIKYHVDHVVPLRSPLVCGLHVETNLQILTATENISKGNRVWPDMPICEAKIQ